MTVGFHTGAEAELISAIDYYEEQERNLGADFSIEVYKTIQRVKTNPKSWTMVSQSIRRILVHRFPYAILYHFDAASDDIFIVAIMHLRKKPGYWVKRIESEK
jgi:plasmid stabilization system protein ParE